MAIQGVGAGAAAQSSGKASLTGSNSDVSGAMQDFLSYMKETPAQRMEDTWLRAHGLTRQQLAAMSPAERQKVMDQMKEDIERQIKQATETKAAGKKNVLD